MKATTRYEGQRRFAGGEGAARVVMDGTVETGGRGEAPTPKEMVLQGLAGCTGLDVAAMLEKQGIPFSEFTVEAEASQTQAHPRTFKRIHLRYRIRVAEADRPRVERAVELSETRFCGVSAMLQRAAEIERTIEFLS